MKGFYFGLILLLTVGLFNCDSSFINGLKQLRNYIKIEYPDGYSKLAKNINPNYESMVQELNEDTKKMLFAKISERNAKNEIMEIIKDTQDFKASASSWSSFVYGIYYSFVATYSEEQDKVYFAFVKVNSVSYDAIPQYETVTFSLY